MKEPFADFAECFNEKITVEMRWLYNRKIKVLGEPIGFEMTLLEAGTPLKIQLFLRETYW